MNRTNLPPHLVALLLTAWIATPAAAMKPADVGPFASVPPASDAAALESLAWMFGEMAGSTTTDSLGAANCGTSGHCNWVGCPDPGCASGQTPAYQCSATAITCEDTHDWYNPFDNDEHNVYDCSSSCVATPDPQPEPECLVDNPVGSGCLVERSSTSPCNVEAGTAMNYEGGVPAGDVGAC